MKSLEKYVYMNISNIITTIFVLLKKKYYSFEGSKSPVAIQKKDTAVCWNLQKNIVKLIL